MQNSGPKSNAPAKTEKKNKIETELKWTHDGVEGYYFAFLLLSG